MPRRTAAVALILRGGPEHSELLLIKRGFAEGDPWSGHMALPGGRREVGDASLLHTAVRETLEEIGADLDVIGRQVGLLSPLAPSSPTLPPLQIQPYVFEVGGDFHPAPASAEVDSIHWVPLASLRDPRNHSTLELVFDGRTQVFPCYRVIPHEVVWGLTYRIVRELLDTSVSAAP